jgi:hypothetical protein
MKNHKSVAALASRFSTTELRRRVAVESGEWLPYRLLFAPPSITPTRTAGFSSFPPLSPLACQPSESTTLAVSASALLPVGTAPRRAIFVERAAGFFAPRCQPLYTDHASDWRRQLRSLAVADLLHGHTQPRGPPSSHVRRLALFSLNSSANRPAFVVRRLRL